MRLAFATRDRQTGPYTSDWDGEAACSPITGCTRDATVEESLAILNAALGTGEWVYTQGGYQGGSEPARNISLRYGDCTDYTWDATMGALGPGWPHGWDQKLATAGFHSMSDADLRDHGYRRIPVDSVRPGDVVVRGGHAGLFVEIDSLGRVMGQANNGLPATPTRQNKNSPTGAFDFSAITGQAPEFFRALVTIQCP